MSADDAPTPLELDAEAFEALVIDELDRLPDEMIDDNELHRLGWA